MNKATPWDFITEILVGKIISYSTTWVCSLVSLACEAYCVLIVAIIIIYLCLCVASTNVIIGAMIGSWSHPEVAKKMVPWWSCHHGGMLTLVKSYPGKPRCITLIILHFILCLCIKFQKFNEIHLYIYIYILILCVLLVW
jgi:hypothetical protein